MQILFLFYFKYSDFEKKKPYAHIWEKKKKIGKKQKERKY